MYTETQIVSVLGIERGDLSHQKDETGCIFQPSLIWIWLKNKSNYIKYIIEEQMEHLSFLWDFIFEHILLNIPVLLLLTYSCK